MKHLFLIIVCACTALAVMAGVPKPDAARARQALKNGSGAVSTPVSGDRAGQVSLHQFMREHKVTPSDNRLTKKAPPRLSPENMAVNRIVAVEAQALEFDENDFMGVDRHRCEFFFGHYTEKILKRLAETVPDARCVNLPEDYPFDPEIWQPAKP